MAASRKQARPPVSGKGGASPFPLGFTIDLLAVVAVTAAAGLTLVLYDGALEWLFQTLALGWVPVIAWSLGTVVALRYWPRGFLRNWNWWLASAGLTAMTIGVLSFFNPGYGIYSEVSLGGPWGAVLGGEPLWLGILKLAALAVVLPLLAFPRVVGLGYLRGGRWTGAHAGAAAQKGGRGGFHALRGTWRAVAAFLHPRTQRRLFRKFFRSRSGARTDGVQSDLTMAEEAEDHTYLDRGWDASDGLDDLLNGINSSAADPGGKSEWKLPSMGLLAPPEPYSTPEEPLKEMARHIEETLGDHGVMVEVGSIKAGPRIVQFGLVPGWVPRRGGDSRRKDGEDAAMERSRVKVQNILTREKDLALALKTPYLRIEAPVPGKPWLAWKSPIPSRGKCR